MKVKHIVFLILLFATGTTYAQTWNNITGKNSFNDSVRYLKYRHSGNLDSVLTISPTSGNLMFVARSAGGGGYGVDSITITPQGMLCAWASGLSTCYPLGAYYDSSALNSDSTYTYHFSRGVFVDSTYLPKSPIFGGTNLVIRDTTVTVNGVPVRGYIFDASGSGGGGSGSGKVYAGLYLLNVNDSTLKVDSSQVAIKDGFFNPGVIPYSNPLGILTQDYGGLGYDGLNAVIGHNDPSTPTGIRLNGDRAKIQAYLYGLRFQVGITGDSDPTKEYNFYNANHAVPYLRMYTDLNGYYRQHAVFNTDMRIVGLSTDSTAPAQTGVIKYLTVDKTGIVSYGVAAGGVVTDTTTFNWSVLDSLSTPPVSPATGDVYEVGTAGTGAFSGHNKEIATYNGSSYTFEVPVAGNLLYNAATTSVSKYTTVWVRVGKAIIYNGGQIGYGSVTIGTNDNNSLLFRTNGTTRFTIGNTGIPVLTSLAAAGNGFVGISATGQLSKSNFPNTTTRYMTGYGTFGSLYDSARQAISVAGTGLTYNNTTGVITGTGGGAAPDSSWVTAEFGNTPNTIGTLVNQNFSGGSIPSGWSITGSSPQLVTSYAGAKLTVTGGNSWGQPAAGNITGAYASGLQYDTRRMPYEKIDFSMSVVPTTKTAGNVIAVAKGQMGLTFLSNETIAWNLSNDVNSGRVGLGTDTIVTWATGNDSTAKAVFSVGDSLILYYHKEGWSVTAGIYNKTTGIKTITYFNQLWNGAGGKFNIVFLKGTWAVTNVTISSFCRKGVPYFVSTSQWSGSGNTSMQRRTPNLVMNNDVERFEVMGLPSMETKYFNQGGIVTELINDAQASAVVWNSGFNDETAGEGAGATNIATDSVFAPLIRAGIAVYVTSIQPKIATSAHVYNDSLIALAARRNLVFVDMRTPLLNAALAMDANNTQDLLHINDTASIKEARAITAQIGNLIYPSVQKDTLASVKVRGIPVAQTQQAVSLMGVDAKGNEVLVANFLPTVNKWVLNTYNTQSYSGTSFSSTPSQPGGIHMKADITTDSAFNSKNTRGWFGGLNADGLTTIRNVIFDAAGPSGLPGQRFAELTGTNNFLLHAGNSVLTGWTGSNNFIQINNNPNSYTGSGTVAFTTNFGLTSGANNFFAGIGGGKGITTGSANFDWEPSASGPATNVSNTITFGSSATAFNNDIKQTGDVSFGTGANAPNFWFGGRAPAYSVINMNAGGANGTNFDGGTWNFNVSRSTGLKLPGAIVFNSYAPVATGSTLQSTLIPKFRMGYSGFSFGSTTVTTNAPDMLVDYQSTTQGVGVPNMTSAQRDAMANGAKSIVAATPGSGQTSGTWPLVFSGGTGTNPTGYAVVSSGVVTSVVIVTRGSLSVPATTVTIAGGGTPATFTVTYGVTTSNTIYCTDCTATDASTGVMQTWNGTAWKNNW